MRERDHVRAVDIQEVHCYFDLTFFVDKCNHCSVASTCCRNISIILHEVEANISLKTQLEINVEHRLFVDRLNHVP